MDQNQEQVKKMTAQYRDPENKKKKKENFKFITYLKWKNTHTDEH